jgi:uncharacterized protein (TIGR02996 family)
VTTREDLHAVIAADPENREAWHTYADWLQQQGNVRGELIALELALEANNSAELRTARDEFLRTLGAALLGETFSRFHADGYGQIVWRRSSCTTRSSASSPRMRFGSRTKSLPLRNHQCACPGGRPSTVCVESAASCTSFTATFVIGATLSTC